MLFLITMEESNKYMRLAENAGGLDFPYEMNTTYRNFSFDKIYKNNIEPSLILLS